MNRQIKFRAWHYFSKTFLTINNLIINPDSNEIIGVEDINGDAYDISEAGVALLESTGLQDKDGKDIYEGDILQFKSQSLLDSWAGKKMATMVARIYWNQEELAFYIINKKADFKPNMRTDNNQFEIIGNIYENPSLVE